MRVLCVKIQFDKHLEKSSACYRQAKFGKLMMKTQIKILVSPYNIYIHVYVQDF